MSDNKFTLKIDGPGINISREVDEQQVLRVLSVALGGKVEERDVGMNDSASSGQVDGADSIGIPAKVSIGEFMEDLKIESNADRIAAIALYLKQHLNRPQITRSDIPGWFRQAGEPAPKNLHRDFNNAIKQKLVAEDHNNTDHFYVTSTGEKRLRSSQ